MRPEPPRGEGRLLRLWCARGMFVPVFFAQSQRALGPRCADAGHPPGLFAE